MAPLERRSVPVAHIANQISPHVRIRENSKDSACSFNLFSISGSVRWGHDAYLSLNERSHAFADTDSVSAGSSLIMFFRRF